MTRELFTRTRRRTADVDDDDDERVVVDAEIDGGEREEDGKDGRSVELYMWLDRDGSGVICSNLNEPDQALPRQTPRSLNTSAHPQPTIVTQYSPIVVDVLFCRPLFSYKSTRYTLGPFLLHREEGPADMGVELACLG